MISEDVADPRVLLEQFGSHTPDVLWMFTADWETLLFINESYEEVYGRSIEALEDDPTDFLEGVHPEYHDMLESEMERLSNGETVEHEYRVNAEEGYERWVWAKGAPVYEDGEVTRVVGFVRDITDWRRQRERLQRRERVLRDVYEVTADTTRSFPEQVEALLSIGCATLGTEYGTLSEIRGQDYVFEFVHSDDDSIEAGDTVPLSATNCELTATTERTVVLGDIAAESPELTGKAGYEEWGIACYLGAPLFVDGEVYGTFCFYDRQPREEFTGWEVTLVDMMSQWVSYEMTRQRTREELQQQNEQLEAFASIVSHDLRNPLEVASGRLEFAQREFDSEHVDEAVRALDRMESLISDLLTLAREGDGVNDLEPVDLGAALQECWATVETDGATLSVETDTTVRADRSRLHQLLGNLVRNAVEHGGEGVTITVGATADGFYVADDGRGMSAKGRAKAFENGYSTSEDGTGYGLSIVREIAEAHGWEVDVTESVDGGTRFDVTVS